jgi:8-oxo-dGTP diphosphatase
LFRRLAHILRHFPWMLVLPYWIYRFFRPKYSLGAIGILFNPQGDVLLVEHVFHPKTPWGLPGGWVDHNEHPAVTVQREMREELGLNVTANSIVMLNVPFANHLDIVYLCHADDITIGELSFELLNYELPKMMAFQREAIQQAYQLRGIPYHETP